MCLARVLLRRTRVVLLDEATSSVDFATDALMQKAIGESFAHATILTVAHRLHTIIESDRVLVMDAGRAAEFAHPHTLLETPGSLFAALVDELGADVAAGLRRRARERYAESGAAADARAAAKAGEADEADEAPVKAGSRRGSKGKAAAAAAEAAEVDNPGPV